MSSSMVRSTRSVSELPLELGPVAELQELVAPFVVFSLGDLVLCAELGDLD